MLVADRICLAVTKCLVAQQQRAARSRYVTGRAYCHLRKPQRISHELFGA